MSPHEHCITFRHTFYSKVRVDAENGATAGKTELAKELGYDAIHDTVHEIYKNSGYDIALVQRLLQHSSAAVTQRYIGIEPERIEEAIQNHAQLI